MIMSPFTCLGALFGFPPQANFERTVRTKER